jgi:hypothetical protein
VFGMTFVMHCCNLSMLLALTCILLHISLHYDIVWVFSSQWMTHAQSRNMNLIFDVLHVYPYHVHASQEFNI